MDAVVEFVKNLFGFDTNEEEDTQKRNVKEDPFAWPFEDIKPENLHSRGTLEFPFLSETTEQPIEPPMLNETSKNILDNLFIKLRQESMTHNTSSTPGIINTTTTVSPFEKSLLILNKNKADSSLEKVVDQIMGVTKERTPLTTTTSPSTTSPSTTETSFFSSTVENVTELIKDVSAATNSSVNKKSKIHKQITNHITGTTSSQLPENPFFSSAFVESTTSTTTEKSLFSIENIMKKATSTTAELPVYQSSTTNTMTTLNELTDVTTFGLDSPVNISSINFPFRREQTSSGSNSIKDLLSFMHTTKVDPSIIQPIHNPVTFPTKSEPNYFSQIQTIKGESPINTNGSMSEIKEMLNSMLTTKPEPSIIISTSTSTSTESNFFNQSSVLSESPIFSSSSTMESPINITMSSTVDTTTTKLQDIFSNYTTLDQTEITTLTTKIISTASEITSPASEITSAVTEITSAASEITSTASEITSAVSETTIAVREFTIPSTEFTSTTTEIINIAKNVTFHPHNDTGAASPGHEGTNTWAFYVILVTTILILFMVIGGVFLFYKKVKGGKGSGYQVSQMKEYNASSGTVSDTNNVKV